MYPNDAAAATAAGSGVSCREFCIFCCCCWAFCCLFSGASPAVGGSEGCLNCMHSSLLATRRAAEVRDAAGCQSVAARGRSKAWHTRGDCCQNAIQLLKYFGYVWRRRRRRRCRCRCPCPLNGWLPRFLVAMWKLPPLPTMMQHMPMAGHE